MNLEATLPRNDLLAALKWAGQAVPKRPAVQVLSGVRLDASAAAVTVSGFDYETYASEWITAPGAKGAALVHHTSLLRMITALPKGCDVRLDTVDTRLRITAVDIRYMLPLLPIEDYPEKPTIDPAAAATLTAEQWRAFVRPTVAAGRDDTLPVLTALHLDREADLSLTVAATDRYRLGMQNLPTVVWSLDKPVLVPAAVVVRAADLLGRKAGDVRVVATGGKAVNDTARFGIGWRNRILTTRCLEGGFPKYRTLIPAAEDMKYVADLPRADLLAAVERVRVAGARMSPIRVALQDGDTLLVEAGNDLSSDTYAAAEVHGVKVLKGRDAFLSMGLNERYIRDGLQAFTEDTVTVSAKGPVSPQVFRADGSPGWTYLLMPIRLDG